MALAPFDSYESDDTVGRAGGRHKGMKAINFRAHWVLIIQTLRLSIVSPETFRLQADKPVSPSTDPLLPHPSLYPWAGPGPWLVRFFAFTTGSCSFLLSSSPPPDGLWICRAG